MTVFASRHRTGLGALLGTLSRRGGDGRPRLRTPASAAPRWGPFVAGGDPPGPGRHRPQHGAAGGGVLVCGAGGRDTKACQLSGSALRPRRPRPSSTSVAVGRRSRSSTPRYRTPRRAGNCWLSRELHVRQSGRTVPLGELEEPRRLTEWLRDVALADGLLDATAIFGVLLGEILLGQGRPGSAGRIFRDSAGLLAGRDLLGYRPWALAGLARSAGSVGREGVRRRHARGRAPDTTDQPELRHVPLPGRDRDPPLGRAHRGGDRRRPAGAAWARPAGMFGDEVQGLRGLGAVVRTVR